MGLLLKILSGVVAAILLVIGALALWLWPRNPYLPAVQPELSLQRFEGNPIIHGGLHPGLAAGASEGGYVNINGPSVIRVPDWVEEPLGRYYLYFAHHKGDHIRMAYGDSPTGPWTLHAPGVLSLEDSGFPARPGTGGAGRGLRDLRETFSPQIIRDYLLLSYRATVADQAIRRERRIPEAANARSHIASPDVVVDEEGQRLIMYFHGLEAPGYQRSRIAESRDGLEFTVLDAPVFSNYLRGFRFRGEYYVLGMPGIIYRSDRPDGGFLPRSTALFRPDMRHAGVWVAGETLHVFWSRVGDAPEGILYSRVDMSSPDWDDWQATEGVEIMRPEKNWEGAELPIFPSLRGENAEASHELRDPFVFLDEEGAAYLYYTGAGEQAIGVATLNLM